MKRYGRVITIVSIAMALPYCAFASGVKRQSSGSTTISPATSAGLSNAVNGDVTGSLGQFVLSKSPTFLTNITAPVIIGGNSQDSTLILRPTSAAGISGDDIIFQVGNNGSTEVMRILNNGNIGIGTSNPQYKLEVAGQIKATGGGGGQFGYVTLTSPLSSDSGGTGNSTYTKGDLLTYSSGPTNLVKLPVGTSNGMVLSVDSAATTGLKWGFPANSSAVINTGTQYQLGFYPTSTATLSGATGLTFQSPTLGLSASSAVEQITGTQAASSTGGAELQLRANDGTVMQDNEQLGVLKFSGAEDGSNTIQNSAAIRGVADGNWSAGVNPTKIEFLTAATDTRLLAMSIDSTQNAMFQNKVRVGTVSTLSRALQTGNYVAVGSGVSGGIIMEDYASSSSTAGPTINMVVNDGSAIVSGDRIGRITFGGLEDSSTLQNAVQIAGFANGNWSAGVNPSSLKFQTQTTGSRLDAMVINSSQDTAVMGKFTSTRSADLGWIVASGANTACNTTCTAACVFGMDTGSTTNSLLACTDATADVCLCAGPP